MLLLSIVAVAGPLLADSIPSGWTVLKDRTKACQIGVPPDFKPDAVFTGLAKGPGDTVEVQVFSSANPVKPISDTIAKSMGIERMFENTDKRVFYANKSLKNKDGSMLAGWHVGVPRGTGSCFASITLTRLAGRRGQENRGTIGPAK